MEPWSLLLGYNRLYIEPINNQSNIQMFTINIHWNNALVFILSTNNTLKAIIKKLTRPINIDMFQGLYIITVLTYV